MCLSNVLFLLVWKHSTQYCKKLFSCINKMLNCGNLSINIYRPVFQIEMYNKLVTFRLLAPPLNFPSWLLSLGYPGLLPESIPIPKLSASRGRPLQRVGSIAPIRTSVTFLPPARNNSNQTRVNWKNLHQMIAAPC